MTAAIVWTVLWFVFIGLGAAVFQVVGAVTAVSLDKVWPAIVGWGVAVVWAVFALIQFILQLIATIQLGVS